MALPCVLAGAPRLRGFADGVWHSVAYLMSGKTLSMTTATTRRTPTAI